jgi:Helix-turn-helix domain
VHRRLCPIRVAASDHVHKALLVKVKGSHSGGAMHDGCNGVCKPPFMVATWTRVALGWTTTELARAAKVGVSTVNRLETDQATPIPSTLAAIQHALEAAGVEFIPENGGGAGVRLRKT